MDNVNVVSSATKDLLLKMLTKDYNKRINWKDLFERELTYAESNHRFYSLGIKNTE